MKKIFTRFPSLIISLSILFILCIINFSLINKTIPQLEIAPIDNELSNGDNSVQILDPIVGRVEIEYPYVHIPPDHPLFWVIRFREQITTETNTFKATKRLAEIYKFFPNLKPNEVKNLINSYLYYINQEISQIQKLPISTLRLQQEQELYLNLSKHLNDLKNNYISTQSTEIIDLSNHIHILIDSLPNYLKQDNNYLVYPQSIVSAQNYGIYDINVVFSQTLDLANLPRIIIDQAEYSPQLPLNPTKSLIYKNVPILNSHQPIEINFPYPIPSLGYLSETKKINGFGYKLLRVQATQVQTLTPSFTINHPQIQLYELTLNNYSLIEQQILVSQLNTHRWKVNFKSSPEDGQVIYTIYYQPLHKLQLIILIGLIIASTISIIDFIKFFKLIPYNLYDIICFPHLRLRTLQHLRKYHTAILSIAFIYFLIDIVIFKETNDFTAILSLFFISFLVILYQVASKKIYFLSSIMICLNYVLFLISPKHYIVFKLTNYFVYLFIIGLTKSIYLIINKKHD